jgi:4-amino-4-deoxy-L-arabinose transferase-like glycosyltransferase
MPLPMTHSSEMMDSRIRLFTVERSLLVVGCGLRIVFFFFSEANGGDAFSRAAITVYWLQHPSLNLDFGGPTWPPLHFWLIALFAKVVPDVLLAGRLLSLVAALVSLGLFWRLSIRLYGESASLLSLTLFVFYSLHIGYATASSSEDVFLAFILGGLLGIFSFRRTGEYGYLLAGGFSLTAAAAIRFEGWILIFGVGLLFLFGREGERISSLTYWKSLAAFALTAGAWPIFWTIRSWLLTGHPFYSLTVNRTLVPGQLAVFAGHGPIYQLALLPGVILLTLTPLATIGTLYGLWLSYREKKSADFGLLLIFFGLFQAFTAATSGVVLKGRFTIILGTFCALVAGLGLLRLGDLLRLRRGIVLAIVAVVSAINLEVIVRLSQRHTLVGDKFRSISPLVQFSVHLEDTGNFLRPRIQPTDNLVIDNFNDEPNLVARVIGLPLLSDGRVFTVDFDAKEANPFPYINSHHPRYAILSPRGPIGASLSLPPNCPKSWVVQGLNFQCLHENELYRIYQIDYP